MQVLDTNSFQNVAAPAIVDEICEVKCGNPVGGTCCSDSCSCRRGAYTGYYCACAKDIFSEFQIANGDQSYTDANNTDMI